MLSKEQILDIQREHLLDDDELSRAFGVLGDSNRWRIFKLLSEYQDLCVTDLANILDVSVPAVSQQLRVMELSGLIKKERMGQMTCYKIHRGNPITQMVDRLVRSFRKMDHTMFNKS